jgi:hypothetical protein
MLSGYATGPQLGFPLAAGLVVAAVTSLALVRTPDLRGTLGVGIVGLFALLIAGRFFTNLTTTNAILLFAAPLLGWLPELPFVRRLAPRLVRIAGVALAAIPVAVALALAGEKFRIDTAPPSSTPDVRQPSIEDYSGFRK